MLRGIQAEYHAYSWSSNPEGYSFAFELEKNITVEGKGFATQEERDDKAIEVAEELDIVLPDYLMFRLRQKAEAFAEQMKLKKQQPVECKKCNGGPACPEGERCF